MLKFDNRMAFIRHTDPGLLTSVDDLDERLLGDRVQSCARVQHDLSDYGAESGAGVVLAPSTLVLNEVPTGVRKVDQSV